MTCIHLLKIASDSNLNFFFGKNYSHLASAEFDPCILHCIFLCANDEHGDLVADWLT